jgi:uncharacterized protein (UPF0335 family)
VTTLAVVSAAMGAGFSVLLALVLGMANRLEDGFSIAVCNYQSVKAQREFIDVMPRTDEEHIDTSPDGEREEIRQTFRQKGFDKQILENIINTVTHDRRLSVDTMLRGNSRLSEREVPPSWRRCLTGVPGAK